MTCPPCDSVTEVQTELRNENGTGRPRCSNNPNYNAQNKQECAGDIPIMLHSSLVQAARPCGV